MLNTEVLMENEKASKATISRLPRYLRYLLECKRQGKLNISSTTIANDMQLNSVQVRKDLAIISSVAGKPKLGFDVDSLIHDIEGYLGYNNTSEAVIVGVGGLGRTLLSYDGFKKYGLHIVAGFDVNPEVVGQEINHAKVYPFDELPKFIKENKIYIGIITTPKAVAQSIAETMISSGIKAIWSFAPCHLKLPENIALKQEDMASSLAVLSKRLSEIMNNEN